MCAILFTVPFFNLIIFFKLPKALNIYISDIIFDFSYKLNYAIITKLSHFLAGYYKEENL